MPLCTRRSRTPQERRSKSSLHFCLQICVYDEKLLPKLELNSIQTFSRCQCSNCRRRWFTRSCKCHTTTTKHRFANISWNRRLVSTVKTVRMRMVSLNFVNRMNLFPSTPYRALISQIRMLSDSSTQTLMCLSHASR